MFEVTEGALIKRINRAIRCDDLVLRKLRGDRWRHNLGDFYVINWRYNCVVFTDVDIVDYGRELGVLGSAETVPVIVTTPEAGTT